MIVKAIAHKTCMYNDNIAHARAQENLQKFKKKSFTDFKVLVHKFTLSKYAKFLKYETSNRWV